MKDKKLNEQAMKNKKQESALITKESISAVCALFSFLILLVLCTDSIIFGKIGQFTQDFFLGVFGYFAYPLLCAGIYLSVAIFLDKRWVKNRFVFATATATVVTFLLILQLAFTYSWPVEGYAKACFAAGEKFVTSTILGVFGGCIISVVVSVLGKIGALIALSLLCVLFIFATVVVSGNKLRSKKGAIKSRNGNLETAQSENTNTQYPSQTVVEPQINYPPMQRESFSGSSYSYAPRPSVIINENEYYKNTSAQTPNSGFSPFSGYKHPPQAETVSKPSSSSADLENSREFLLGSTPAEIYQKNLIFDSKAKVNNRVSVDSKEQGYSLSQSQASVPQNGFSSYTNSYEESLNERKSTGSRYDEIGTNNSFASNYNGTTDRSSYLNLETERVDSIVEEEPIIANDRGSSDREYFIGSNDRVRENDSAVIENDRVTNSTLDIAEEKNEGAYRRHEYMDYFSLSNPNIFGDRGGNPEVGREIARRDTAQEFSSFNVQRETPIENSFGRREESPYTLNNDREFTSNTTEIPERADVGTSVFEEEPVDALNIFDDDQSQEIEPPKAFENTERRIGFGSDFTDRNLQSVAFRRETTPVQSERVAEQKVEETPIKKPRIYRPYVPAPLHYFDCSDVVPDADPLEIEEAKREILNVYSRNGFTDMQVESVEFGPTLTRYNVSFDISVVSSNKLITKEIEASMSLALRVKNGVNMYLNYEERHICIEAPNKRRQSVQLGCMLTGSKYTDAKPGSLVFAIGKDIVNNKLYGDIAEMVHLLVAGSTGAGKSVFLNALIISLINRYSPEELRLILIDPKRAEFVIYSDLPHLMINEIITDPRKAIQSLNWAIGEMNRRYDLFAQMSKRGKLVRNLDEYNAALTSQEEKLPKIVIVVDELADLVLASKKEVEERIQNITQKSRAAGIHMIIATQRPSVDVVTGVIKANLATRFAFTVTSDTDSRVILDASGAQKLLGRGDMFYGKVGTNLTRAQSAFISSEDCQRVVDFIRENNEAYYDEDVTNYINNSGGQAPVGDVDGGEPLVEEVYIEALKYVIQSNSASISMIQRKCSVGFPKAGKIVEWMEDMGYISPYEGPKARKILITKEEFEKLYGEF